MGADEKLLDAVAVAEKLNMSRSTVYQMAREGKFSGCALAIGKCWRWSPSALDEWLRKQMEQAR